MHCSKRLPAFPWARSRCGLLPERTTGRAHRSSRRVGRPAPFASDGRLTIVVSGRTEMSVGDETGILGPGEVVHIPDGVEHGVVQLDGLAAVAPRRDLFSYRRSAYGE
ncbi:cupin domain-containing protein [Ancylobacter sp. VNQ12]|uniref:cupin domain-containing protein n=1 Tax=Ancylobacter sp. VNQ12 TaxID=3400920 RepID=UPI003C0C3FB6